MRTLIPAVDGRLLRSLTYPLLFAVAFTGTYYYRTSNLQGRGAVPLASVIPAIVASTRGAFEAPSHINQQVAAASHSLPALPPTAAGEGLMPDAAATVDPQFAAVLQGQREDQLRDLSLATDGSGSIDDRKRAVTILHDMANTGDEDGRARQLLIRLTHDPDAEVSAAAAAAFQSVLARQGAQN